MKTFLKDLRGPVAPGQELVLALQRERTLLLLLLRDLLRGGLLLRGLPPGGVGIVDGSQVSRLARSVSSNPRAHKSVPNSL